MKTTLERLDQA